MLDLMLFGKLVMLLKENVVVRSLVSMPDLQCDASCSL